MSFAELLNVHERLNELFLLHQEALLRLDLELAAERLRIYERELRAHMRAEEDLLMPIYERAGKIAGGPPEFSSASIGGCSNSWRASPRRCTS